MRFDLADLVKRAAKRNKKRRDLGKEEEELKAGISYLIQALHETQ